MFNDMYKNLKLAYQIEVAAAILTLIAIGTFGEIGIAAITVIALRPALLERTKITPEAIKMFYSVVMNSIIITLLTLLAFFLSTEYIFDIESDWRIIVILILPYFLLSHGIVGLIYYKIKSS
jgi:hypothetical protein